MAGQEEVRKKKLDRTPGRAASRREGARCLLCQVSMRYRGGEERGADPALARRLGRPGGAGSKRERGMNGVMGSGSRTWITSDSRRVGSILSYD